jgi:hypothetical protein
VSVDGSGDVTVPGATPDGWDGLAWSPDGKRIAFDVLRSMEGGGATTTVYVVNAGGAGDVRASWSPNKEFGANTRRDPALR